MLIYGGARVYTELFGLTKSIRGTNDVINDTEAEELLIKVESKVAALDEVAQSALKSRLLPQDDIDKIIIRAMYIDDEIGNNAMLTMIKDLAQKPNFKNPDDLLYSINKVWRKDGTIDRSGSLDLLNEFNEGKYWLNQGESGVYVSKEFGKGIDEIDVRLENLKAIVECKRVSGSDKQVTVNIRNIIDKFTIETKLSIQMKQNYPNFYGSLKIDGGGIYKTLAKNDFINELKNSGVIGSGNGAYFTIDDLKKIQRLDVTNDTGRFTILNTDW